MGVAVFREVFATARIARLITEDEITEPIRDYVQGRWPDSRFTYLVTCPACTSVWAGAFVVLARRSPVLGLVVSTLALSEMALALRRVTDEALMLRITHE